MPTTPAAAAAARCSSSNNCTPSARGSLLHAPAVSASQSFQVARYSSRGRVVAAAAPNCRQQQAVVAAAVLDALSISTPSDLASSSNATTIKPSVTPDPRAAAGRQQRGAFELNRKAVPSLKRRNRSARPSTLQRELLERKYPKILEVSCCVHIAERQVPIAGVAGLC
jgi:hypothetical protein